MGLENCPYLTFVHDIRISKIFEFEPSKSFVMIFLLGQLLRNHTSFLNLNLIFASNCFLHIHLKKSKQRFGEFIDFGGSDVTNKLFAVFMRIGGSENVQKYDDVIKGWSTTYYSSVILLYC